MTTHNSNATNVSSTPANLSDKNQPTPISKGQNRRDTLLKGLALLPIPSVLAACGGGGDAEPGASNATTSSASASSSAASGPTESITADGVGQSKATTYTLPSVLVPEDNQFQFEVVFTTNNVVNVFLIESGGQSIMIANKPYTQSPSHAVGFGLFRCDELDGTPNKSSFKLQVNALEADRVGITRIIVPSTDTSSYAEYKEHNDGRKEYEWTFYSVFDGIAQRLCYVRFFPLAPDDREVFTHEENVLLIENTARHQNAWALTTLSPKLHVTNISIPSHEAGVFHDDVRNENTIALPNRRHGPGHRELMPCYLEVAQGDDARFKRALGRRLEVHMANFKVKMAGVDPIDTRLDQNPFYALGNELFTVMGGHDLMNGMNKLRAYLVEQGQIDSNYTGVNQLAELLRETIADISNAEAEQGTRDLKDAVVARQARVKDEWDAAILGGVGVTTALQIGGSRTNYLKSGERAPEFLGLVAGGGWRVSLGLNKYSAAISTLGDIDSDYKIRNPSDGEYKIGLVGIVKSWSTEAIRLKGVSMDLEITLSLTVKYGRFPRLDSVTIDPVVDYDTSKLITRIIQTFKPGTRLVTDSAISQAVKFEKPTFIINAAAAVGAALTTFTASPTAAFALSGFAQLLSSAAGYAFAWKNYTITDYKTSEASLLRLAIVNILVNDPDVPFTPKFWPVTAGWAPAMKYISGVGVVYEKSVEDGPSIRTKKYFVRYVAIAEATVAIGHKNFVRSFGYPMSHGGGG